MGPHEDEGSGVAALLPTDAVTGVAFAVEVHREPAVEKAHLPVDELQIDVGMDIP